MTKPELDCYRIALQEARASFDRATRRLREIESEGYDLNNDIGRLRRTITALAAMCSESPWSDSLGITDSCLEVMERERSEVTSLEVVKSLDQMGFDFSSQKNPSASVHAVLSRLAQKGKIQKILNEETEAVTWKGPHFGEAVEISDDDIPF